MYYTPEKNVVRDFESHQLYILIPNSVHILEMNITFKHKKS